VIEGLFTLTMLRKDPSWKMRVQRIAAVTLPLLICASPWIIMAFHAAQNPEYLQTLERLGLLHRRFPAGIHLQLLLIGAGALTFVAGKKSKNMNTAWLILIMLAAGLVVLNQPIITGKEAEFSSHYRQILVFPLWIALFWALSQLLKHAKPVFIAFPLVVLFVIGMRTVEQLKADMIVYEGYRTDVQTRDHVNRLIDAINELPDQHVILAEDEFSRHLMTVYTSHYPFFTTSDHMYLMDEDTLWSRAAVQQKLFPDYRIIPRGMVGSSNLNKALYDQTMCRVRRLLQRTENDCTKNPDDYFPPQWYELQKADPSEEEMMTMLRDANVSYGLMKNIPPWLRRYSTTEKTVDGYELLRFDWLTP
jgi:hypothetical protein